MGMHIETTLGILSQEIASIRYMLLAMVTMLYVWSPELIHLINKLPAPTSVLSDFMSTTFFF